LDQINSSLLVEFMLLQRAHADFQNRVRPVFNGASPDSLVRATSGIRRVAENLVSELRGFMTAFCEIVATGTGPLCDLLGEKLTQATVALEAIARIFDKPQPMISYAIVQHLKAVVTTTKVRAARLALRCRVGVKKAATRAKIARLIYELRGLADLVGAGGAGMYGMKRELIVTCELLNRMLTGIMGFKEKCQIVLDDIIRVGQTWDELFEALGFDLSVDLSLTTPAQTPGQSGGLTPNVARKRRKRGNVAVVDTMRNKVTVIEGILDQADVLLNRSSM
jgi:hypothetical protein